MASLVEVNKTLESIKGDTTNLNDNFDAWFKSLERNKGDELERERERMRLMRTMVAGMGAGAAVGGRGGSGGTGGGGPLGGLKIPKGLNPANWPLWAQILSGSLLLKYGIKTADVLSGGPFRRFGEKQGEKIQGALDRRAEAKKLAEAERKLAEMEARLASQSGADKLTDIEAQADAEAARMRAAENMNKNLAGAIDAPERGRGSRYNQFRQIFSKPTGILTTGLASPKLPTADLKPNVSASIDAVVANAVPTMSAPSAVNVRDVMPKIVLDSTARPLVDAMMKADLNPGAVESLESKHGGKYHVTKDGNVIFRKVDGTFSANANAALKELSPPTLSTTSAQAPKVGPARFASEAMGSERGRGSRYTNYGLRGLNFLSAEGALGEAALAGSRVAQSGSAAQRILAATGRTLLSNAFMTFGFAITPSAAGLGSSPSEVMDAYEYGIYESLRKGDMAGAKKGLKMLNDFYASDQARESQKFLMGMSDTEFNIFGNYWMGYYKTESNVKSTRGYIRMRKPKREQLMAEALGDYQSAFDANIAAGGAGNITIGQVGDSIQNMNSNGTASRPMNLGGAVDLSRQEKAALNDG